MSKIQQFLLSLFVGFAIGWLLHNPMQRPADSPDPASIRSIKIDQPGELRRNNTTLTVTRITRGGGEVWEKTLSDYYSPGSWVITINDYQLLATPETRSE